MLVPGLYDSIFSMEYLSLLCCWLLFSAIDNTKITLDIQGIFPNIVRQKFGEFHF